MATLPHLHPVMKMYCSSNKQKVKRHKSPLHHLSNTFKAVHEDFKTTLVAGQNPALMGKQPFRINIPGNKDESKEVDKQAPEHVKIYSDGSAQDRKVGAATVLQRNGKTIKTLHYHLRSAEEHTVFKAELIGILMGLQLIETDRKSNISYTIGVDNQVAIKALSSKFNKPSHYIAAEALQAAAKIQRNKGKKFSLTIRWTAGHLGIPGNKEADKEAKKAAEGTTTGAMHLPKLLRKMFKYSKLAAIQEENMARKKCWTREWITSS